MNANTYGEIGNLINGIKRDKRVIEGANARIKEDLAHINSLLRKNGQEEIELDDIDSTNKLPRRYYPDDEF